MNWRVRERGAGLAEVLIGVLVISLAAIGVLGFYSHGLGGIQRQGLRRSAAERGRERMEQLMEADLSAIAGNSADGQRYWLTLNCSVTPCIWTRSLQVVREPVSLGGIFNGQREMTVQRIHDRTTGSSGTTLDAVELSVKVWFTSNNGVEDDFNRVQLKTLRAPSP